MLKKFWITLSMAFLLSACGGGEKTLKTVEQQQVGEYTVAVLSESGTMKNGANDFTLEFRKTADNQLVDVGPVEVAPLMEMAGMGPMMGNATVTATETPGRYNATSNLTMTGLWKFTVKFGDGQAVRINVNAE
jgi:hypothetical protein